MTNPLNENHIGRVHTCTGDQMCRTNDEGWNIEPCSRCKAIFESDHTSYWLQHVPFQILPAKYRRGCMTDKIHTYSLINQISMEKANQLPFSNLDPEMAWKVPNSPYMDFHMALRGKVIFDKATMLQVFKWEVWNKYKSRKDLIQQVIDNEHKDYVLIDKTNFNA